MSNGYFPSQNAHYPNNAYSNNYHTQPYIDTNSYPASYPHGRGVVDGRPPSMEGASPQMTRPSYVAPKISFDRPSTALGIASYSSHSNGSRSSYSEYARGRVPSQSSSQHNPGYAIEETSSYNPSFGETYQSNSMSALQYQQPYGPTSSDTIPHHTSYPALSTSVLSYNTTHHSQYPASPTRPFVCDQCPLSFNRQHDLKRHRETHTGDRPFECNGGCGKTFTRKDALRRHQLVKGCGSSVD